MYVIMGATGHVGRAAARCLLGAGHAVTVATRNAQHAEDFAGLGARVVETDVRDVDALSAAFRCGRRAFLLNPPADVSSDTDAEEQETVRCILAALDGSGLERVVAASTYGARHGEGVGDLTVLHGFEEGLRRQPIPAAVVRSAYYMSNWDAALSSARRDGTLPTLFPADLRIPMVAPADVGRRVAELLGDDGAAGGLHHVEGPERYSSDDVAAAFGRALGREVRADVTPRAHFEAAFRKLGFSDPAARSYARMTQACLDEGFEVPERPWRGTVTLDAYVRSFREACVPG